MHFHNYYKAASQFAHVLMGPFWDRVGRCSASDVQQLTFFHDKRVAALDAFAKLMTPPKYNLGLATIIGAYTLVFVPNAVLVEFYQTPYS